MGRIPKDFPSSIPNSRALSAGAAGGGATQIGCTLGRGPRPAVASTARTAEVDEGDP